MVKFEVLGVGILKDKTGVERKVVFFAGHAGVRLELGSGKVVVH